MLLIGTVVAGVLLAVRTVGGSPADIGFIVRDSAGLAGLAAVGATVCGARNAWTVPVAWLSFSLFAPPSTGVPRQVVTWMTLPPGSAVGTWTALALAVVGTAAYAFAGPRR
ncbi:hypothetical protein [Streptomyces sp. NPDC058155]|uniref:hypothetical protein n=1 Tax=Streptomyces sp. NPDC058155 TaxID=3346359 RepID=UPI0036F070E5